MTAPAGGRPCPWRRRRAAAWCRAACTAALALPALLAASAPSAAAPASRPVLWPAYRAAAERLLPAARGGPVRLRAASPLAATVVRFPGGTLQRVSPHLLIAGLGLAPASPEGSAARAALRRIAGAPATPPPPPVSRPAATRQLSAVLADPAFAASRPGTPWLPPFLAAAWAGLRAYAARLAARLAGAAAFWSGLPPAVARAAVTTAALALVAACAIGMYRLLRAGFDPAAAGTGRRGPRGIRAAPVDPLVAAEERLAAGDAGGAVRMVYAAALDAVAARRGVAVRPGWTARDVYRAAGLDGDWPVFAALGGLHERVLFGPPGPPEDVGGWAAEAAAWVEEVRRWSAGRPSTSGSPSWPPA